MPLKVLFCGRSTGHFEYHLTVIEALLVRGHSVELMYDEEWSRNTPFGRSLKHFRESYPNLTVGWSRRRQDRRRDRIFGLRELRSVSSYLRRGGQSAFYLNRWQHYLPPEMRERLKKPMFRRMVSSKLASVALAAAERFTPPAENVMEHIRSVAPDIVVCSPGNMRFSEEVEYLKAAKKLGIPTMIPIQTWDNLSTKGLLNILPEMVLAWNPVHASEAVSIHGMQPARVAVTGSPFFDRWFDDTYRAAEDRPAFMRRVGLDPKLPFLLYLGSSANIAKDESWLVESIIKGFAEASDPSVQNMQVLIRPHPANTKNYPRLLRKGVRIWPRESVLPEDPETRRDFVSSMVHSEIAVSINTSGMIDALIFDRPVVAMMVDQYAATQAEAVHFQHMREANCIYEMKTAEDLTALVAQMRREGETETMKARRKAFVRDMVRPFGAKHSAGAVIATAIEVYARTRQPGAVKDAIAAMTKAGKPELAEERN